MSFYLIRTIARYEMKTLLRSWFFRIFAGMAIFGLGIFNMAMNIEASGAPWIYRALPAAIPYANLIILNLGQAIVAIFLASEFLKQDRKNDTVEVIYARSMSNGEYILGKTLGILLVFFILNVIILLIGIGFSFLSNDSARNLLSLLAYPLLISLPTLIFIFGLSFFLMILLKNQAITFLLLLGYIALTVFYLSQKAYHIFDFIAYNVPMMYSSISGFGNITEILLHRGIFLLSGIALIFITIHKLPRLPQSRSLNQMPLIISSVFFITTSILVFQYIDLKRDNNKFKEQVIKLNNKLSDYLILTVTNCEISLEHKGKSLDVKCLLELQNQNNTKVDTIILRLNPLLKINSLKVNTKETGFERNLHIVKIFYNSIEPGEKILVELKYNGGINENICFIDKDSDEFKDNYTIEMFNLRKRYAFLQDDYVCLTSDALWYPMAGPGYSANKPLVNHTSFTNFKLHVKAKRGFMAISQGNDSVAPDGTYHFNPENPLPKISLVIADYSRKSIIIDSVEYNLFTIKGNEYYNTYFNEIDDTLSSVIKGLRQDFEVQYKLKYPFARFSLVEVPVLFAIDVHSYSITSEAVQPEMVFYPEKASILEDSDFRKRKKRTEEDMKKNNEEILPEDLQTRMFQQCIRNNLMAKPENRRNFDEVEANTFSVFPLFYTYACNLESEKWPLLNFAMEGWMKEKSGGLGNSVKWFFEGLTKQEKINIQLLQAPLEKLMIEGISNKDDERNPIYLKDVVLAKGIFLFNTWNIKFGNIEFNRLILEMINNNRFNSINMNELDSMVNHRFNSTVLPDLDKWFSQEKLPGFLVKDLSICKIQFNEGLKYQLSFKISNPEPVDGLFLINVELNEPNRVTNWWEGENVKADYTKSVYLASHSAKEIGVLFNSQPQKMEISTNVSLNLPASLKYDFTELIETKKVKAVDTIAEIPSFLIQENENSIIVDNEDTGFSIEEEENQAFLKSLINKKSSGKYDYTDIRFWNVPEWWEKALKTGFYGNYIHSAFYTKAGNGERKAKWTASLKEDGYYDVYFYYTKTENPWRQNKNIDQYSFNIYHDEAIEKVSISSAELENGWNFLGSWFFATKNASIELSNKSGGEIVVADAVKWVKTK